MSSPKLQDKISPIWDEALDFDQFLACFSHCATFTGNFTFHQAGTSQVILFWTSQGAVPVGSGGFLLVPGVRDGRLSSRRTFALSAVRPRHSTGEGGAL